MFSEIIKQLPSYFESQNNPVVYLLLFFSAVLENLIPPIPGDVVTAFGAFMVGTGKLHFIGVYIATTLGATTGFTLLFLFGKFLGKEFMLNSKFTFFKYDDILKAEQWVQKYGSWLVLLNRFLPGIRSVISLTAGFSNLSTHTVLLFSLLSASVWNLIIIYLGYSLGNNWFIVQNKISHILSQYSKVLLFAGGIVLLVYIAIKFKKYVAKN